METKAEKEGIVKDLAEKLRKGENDLGKGRASSTLRLLWVTCFLLVVDRLFIT